MCATVSSSSALRVPIAIPHAADESGFGKTRGRIIASFRACDFGRDEMTSTKCHGSETDPAIPIPPNNSTASPQAS